MKPFSLISAAFAAASSAYAFSAGNTATGPVASRALTTMFVNRYWNSTSTSGVIGLGRGYAGPTETSGIGVVVSSRTGEVGQNGISVLLPNNGTGRYKYTASIGVPAGLDYTTTLSLATAAPTPANSVIVVAGIGGVAPTGYVHAYYGDPLRHQHLSVIPDDTIFHNMSSVTFTKEVVRAAGTVKRYTGETVEEALNYSLPDKNKVPYTYQVGSMARTQVFVRLAQPTAQTKLELRGRHGEDDILAEDGLRYATALNLNLGHMINCSLTSENRTIEKLVAIGDDDLEERQFNIQISPCKVVGENFGVVCGRHEVNVPERTGKRIGAGVARKLGSPVRPSTQDGLAKEEFEVDVGAYIKYKTPFNRPAEKLLKQLTHDAIVHTDDDITFNVDEQGISAGSQSEIDRKLLLLTFSDLHFRNFQGWNKICEWFEKNFTQRLVPSDQGEDVEVVESFGESIEVSKREAFYRVMEKVILKDPPRIKLVSDMPIANTAIWVADGDKTVAAPAVDANVAVTVTVWTCGGKSAADARRQIATVITEYGNQNLNMASLQEPTTFRTVRISLPGAAPGPTVVLSGNYVTSNATAAPSTATRAQI